MAILTKGTTFADGDQVTSTKLNNLVDSAAFVAGASGSTDDATLEVASGQLRVKTIQTGNIANGAVTTGKIADSTGAADGVTAAKLATSAVTTAKIADLAVTAAKLGAGAVTEAKVFAGNGTFPIKVQQVVKSDTQSVTGGAWTDVGSLSLAFTRVNVTSKVRVQAMLACANNSVGAINGMMFRLVRASTEVGVPATAGSRILATGAESPYSGRSTCSVVIDFIDDVSAVATNPLTYKVQAFSPTGVTMYVNRSGEDTDSANHVRTISTMTLTELA